MSWENREWTLQHLFHPEPIKPGLATHRVIQESCLKGNALDFMTGLGYSFQFEYTRRGFLFHCGAIQVHIYRIYQVARLI